MNVRPKVYWPLTVLVIVATLFDVYQDTGNVRSVVIVAVLLTVMAFFVECWLKR